MVPFGGGFSNYFGGNPYSCLFRQAVACLCAFAFANEATFFHETAEEPYNAIVSQCLLEGNGNVFLCVMVFCREQSV